MVRSTAAANAAANAKVHHCINVWGAKLIPLVVCGIVGYATWVVIVTLAIDYLIHPPQDVQARPGAGIAIIVIYFVLFILMALSYLRILQVVATNPGFVPLSHTSGKESSTKPARTGVTTEEKEDSLAVGSGLTPSDRTGYLDRGALTGGRASAPSGLEIFYKRDVFECEIDGLPRWCSTCNIWKPDRSHHCREVGRCVYKMDHYCPWAGGIISETSFKFFVLFCTYATVYAIFNLIVAAYFLTERRHSGLNFRANNWIAVIVLAAFFGLFAATMAGNSLFFTFLNTTTVDNLSRRTRIYHFAVLLPSHDPANLPTMTPAGSSDTTLSPPYATITYPLPSTHPLATNSSPPHSHPRTFAILASTPGASPYKLPSTWQNIKAVMGTNPIDWFLPFRSSPNYLRREADEHDLEAGAASEGRSMYALGDDFEKLCKSANVDIPAGVLMERRKRKTAIKSEGNG